MAVYFKTSLPLLNPPPTSPPSHHSRLSQSTGFGFSVSYSKFLLVIYFTCSNVCVSVVFSQIIPPSLSPLF